MAARKALGPYARGRLVVRALGQTLALDVPHDVFSSQRIDDGTLLLLDHLPAGEPRSVLDLGCGYGALGLPVAARFPAARCVLLDRDLLAVAASAHNARVLGLTNATVQPGLGYRGLQAERFDWVLCNVPARIGARAIRYLLEGGRALGAEVRAVVIRDLAQVVEGLGLPGLTHVARGPRHDVFSLARSPAADTGTARAGTAVETNAAAGVAVDAPSALDLDDDAVYARDQTNFDGLSLFRPHDASEDPAHLAALALLAEPLPRKQPKNAFVFRANYGALPLAIKARHPGCEVVAQDRDLLDTAFLRRNAAALRLPVEVLEDLFWGETMNGRVFSLVCGELAAPPGAAVAKSELNQAAQLLAPGGEALILASEKQEREWLRGQAATVLLRRGPWCVLRISRPRG
ncbi:MAG TPA: methyltransferase [Myxococcales bacterium]